MFFLNNAFNTKVLSKFTTLLDSRRTISNDSSSNSNNKKEDKSFVKHSPKKKMKKPTTKHPFHLVNISPFAVCGAFSVFGLAIALLGQFLGGHTNPY